ncbi:hypothetical protein EGI15_11365 [Chryseobacterium cucumeris]|uniref:Platelet-derived growth factor (PDGF) family profile domain-containing protein n=1 Tax=Chryseobacterium cucumeris TaxID=1813611 RepID=A0ABX9X7A2_9FLAO|nr:hypothetical protein EGI15_11365 [Chryseobacterium cucumeris]TXI89188.1 MAG: hypothetical protein E6Q36_03780 [Chryseobacterium sp.]
MSLTNNRKPAEMQVFLLIVVFVEKFIRNTGICISIHIKRLSAFFRWITGSIKSSCILVRRCSGCCSSSGSRIGKLSFIST